jgi:hypothetical protein
MKKLYSLILVATTSFSFAQVTLPFSDSFSYPAGNLHETSPWSALGTPNASDHILLDGSKVTFAGGGTDAQVLFESQNSGTIFYRFKLNITSMAGVTDANGGYFAGFAQNSSTFGGTIWAKRANDDDNSFHLGIEVRTGTAANTTYSTEVYSTGTTYNIIVAYTFNENASDDTTRLWVNATSLTDESTPLLTDTHTGTDLSTAAAFFLRQDSNAETGSYEIDDLTVSTSFSELLSSKSNTIAGLKVYPNPVSNGKLFIETAANAERNVAIFDVLGKKVLNTITNDSEVNVSSLNAGVYIVKITEEGKSVSRKLVIK